MRTFLVQLLRELRSIFYTPVAYVVIALFAGLMGFNFQSYITVLNKQPADVTVLEIVFLNALFIFVFAFIAALITMRSFAEEFRLGTVEMLMTAPVKDWHVVLAKFFGASIFLRSCWCRRRRASGSSTSSRRPRSRRKVWAPS